MPLKISQSTQIQVRERAGFLCEYCHTDEHWQLVPFTIDHIIPITHGGSDEIGNLALACFHCNRRKSNKLSVQTADSKSEVPLFDPRTMKWSEHFEWSQNGLLMFPKSDIGSATIELLNLNRERIVRIRQDDILANRHPPKIDID